MMSDKEIGKLWASLRLDCGSGPGCLNHGTTLKLIYKLVAERREVIASGERGEGWNARDMLAMALADFNIPPSEFRAWKEGR